MRSGRRIMMAAIIGIVGVAVVGAVVVGVAAHLGGAGKTVEVPAVAQSSTPPANGDLATFDQTRVFFGHQSVGVNIISGFPAVFGAAPQPDVVESRDARGAQGGYFQHAAIGGNGDPLGKIADFKALVESGIGDNVDVALMKLCYVDFTSSTDPQAVFDAYAATMETLEREYPNVAFVYTTVPLTTDPGWFESAKSTFKVWLGRSDSSQPVNLVRGQFNELVRERYANTGRLFDIAALESQLDNGNHAAMEYQGTTYMVMNPGLASDGAHLNDAGAKLLAADLVRVVASTQQR